jgi:hypothetical protein
MNELTALLARHCRDNLTTTLIPRLTLSRSDLVTELASAFYHPLLCIIAAGRKRVSLGNEVLTTTQRPTSSRMFGAPPGRDILHQRLKLRTNELRSRGHAAVEIPAG